MPYPIHDPRDPRCRSPFGAVRTGENVTLRIAAPRIYQVCDAVLELYRCPLVPGTALGESEGEASEIPLRPALIRLFGEDYDLFETELSTKDFTGLLFYRFRLRREEGEPYRYGKMEGSPSEPAITGGIYNTPQAPCWQLTVYREQNTPPWFGEGITYGIFPDRFCRGEDSPADSSLKPWGDTPKYLPDADGLIRRDDFFGGNLAGIRQRLPYLHRLGVGTLYLNPIFEAASNHRYDTGDYEKIDSHLGTDEDFRTLCREAHALGMRVLLDGVFSHTGAVSRYFNADGRYPDIGAAQSKDSPYYRWYQFRHWPEDYQCWWDVRALPCTREEEPSYLDYIVTGTNSILRRWMAAGADGWRLDVADELPDGFLDALHETVRAENPAGLILGEVWEDASNKAAYGFRRRYLLGQQLDGVMNYPLRGAILAFLTGGDAYYLRQTWEALEENYPPAVLYACMNFLGTHDTPRILNLLSGETMPQSPDDQSKATLSPAALARAKRKLKLAAVLLYAFPGSPMVFYGDEAGLTGWGDPFNRGCYPWGREDTALVDWFTGLGALRNASRALKRGTLRFLQASGGRVTLARETEGERVDVRIDRDSTDVAVLRNGECVLTLT